MRRNDYRKFGVKGCCGSQSGRPIGRGEGSSALLRELTGLQRKECKCDFVAWGVLKKGQRNKNKIRGVGTGREGEDWLREMDGGVQGKIISGTKQELADWIIAMRAGGEERFALAEVYEFAGSNFHYHIVGREGAHECEPLSTERERGRLRAG